MEALPLKQFRWETTLKHHPYTDAVRSTPSFALAILAKQGMGNFEYSC